ncbi:Putative ribonuclease H protein At1g65750 [Linum perenne]
MTPPSSSAGADLPIWGLEGNGQYSVRSGYLLASELVDNSDSLWRDIWRWEGPQRIRHFLWLAAHSKLLTNVERGRRHLTTTEVCGICSPTKESMLHVVRDCSVAKEVWQELLGVNLGHEFFQVNDSDWWRKYISDKVWACTFGITTWTLWETRNERIFEGKNPSKSSILARIRFWSRLVSTSFVTARNIRQKQLSPKIPIAVRWCAAEQPCVTINSDGSVIGRGRGAASGGCIRDGEGGILDAFACNLGRCSITRAELTGAVIGLERAWDIGARKVEIQMDSLCAISILEGGFNLEHQHAGQVLRFRQLRERDWTIRLTHIYREGNHLADYLANKGHSLAYGTHSIRPDDAMVLYWARYDFMGCEESRMIRAM